MPVTKSQLKILGKKNKTASDLNAIAQLDRDPQTLPKILQRLETFALLGFTNTGIAFPTNKREKAEKIGAQLAKKGFNTYIGEYGYGEVMLEIQW